MQSYRLPAKLSKKYKELPKRLCPVFIDKDELVPGNLSDSLKEHISLCKYFISVCSKNCQKSPEYIDLELSYFLETHDNDYSKVIPFIVDESPEPEKECFSPLMSKVCSENQIIGVNVNERGKRRAFLKVIAYMHGLLVSEIESADDRRRRKNTVLSAISALLAILLCAFGVSYWWNDLAIHKEYYKDYIWVGNSVCGVSRIAKGELSSYSKYYEIESRGGYVRSLSFKNHAGIVIPLDEGATVLDQNASKIEFSYSGEGEEKYLSLAKYYDYNGLPIVCYQYSKDGTHVTLLQDETSGISGYANKDAGASGLFLERINVSRYIQEYDGMGRLTKRYFAYGEDYIPMSDGDGNFGYELSYDEAGNLARVQYFSSRDGKNIGETDGVAATEYEYDSDSKVISISYFDIEGKPALSDGYAEKVLSFGKNNAVETIEYKDPEGALVLHNGGYARIVNSYNGAYLSGQSYFGCDGKPINIFEGYASVEYKLNGRGEISYERYLDANGEPVTDTVYGVYGYELVRESDSEYYKKYIDKNGEPAETKGGYAYIYVTADEYGYPLKQEFRDAEGELCSRGYAWCTYKYDPIYHNVTEHAFYDSEGNLTYSEELGTAKLISEFDLHGRLTEQRYIGTDGELANGPNGYARTTCFYENDGTFFTETRMFYDENDKPVINKDLGAYGCEYSQYENGNMAGFYYLDENKFPYYAEENGFAGVIYLYDEYGYMAYVSYFKSPNQGIKVNGFASMSLKHDEKGNLLQYVYYDEKGDPFVNPEDGFAGALYGYDENGNMIEVSYFDENMEYMNNTVSGYAAAFFLFDENGKVVGGSFYEVKDGKLVKID